MKVAVPRISALLGAILALAACGTTASPSASVHASATPEPASEPLDLLAVVCAPVPKPFDPSDIDLTGTWAGDDGGVYYLRQLGSVVWWNGMSGREGSPMDLGREWNNVVRGAINGLQIDAEWSDVPRGESDDHGTLVLSIQDDGTGNIQIVQVSSSTGGFGSHVWTPCSPAELRVAEYVLAYGGHVREYADILTLDACDDLAELETSVTATMNTEEAGSPEFRAALGYSNAISERQLALRCD
jgi:hypothetical protein